MSDSIPSEEKSLQFRVVYQGMNQAYRDTVVNRALNFRDQLSSVANSALNSAIQKSRISVTGFRDPLRAPHTQLRDPVSRALDFYPELAGAMLRAWAESQQTLHDKIVEHLKDTEIEAEYPDFEAGEFRRRWSQSSWQLQTDKFVERNSEDDFNENDVALMLCYVTGRVPLPAGNGEPDEVAGAAGEYLNQFLDFLKALPPTAPEWRERLPNFVESVSVLVKEKESELKWADEFDAILQSVKADFAEMLAFFEQDTEAWRSAKVSQESDKTAALGSVGQLSSLLAEYLPIHDRASGITEERERIRQRDELQTLILETFQAIEELMTAEANYPVTVPSAPPEPATGPVGAAIAPPASSAAGAPVPGSGYPPVASRPEGFAVAEPSQGEHADAADFTALESENRDLRDDADALRAENQNLRDEVEALRTEIYSSQDREDSWRMAYRSAKDGSMEEEEEPLAVVGSVSEAVEMAKSKFRQELLFSPNSESNIDSNPYIFPNKVWEALHWLANTYYPSKMGRLRVTDFDQSIREACGWWYKGDQGETTLSRYEKSYTTRVDGKRYWLAEHIGKGTNFDARYTIRIAFDWDRERRQVIVGYIGRHQQTDAS